MMSATLDSLNETIRFYGGTVTSVPQTWPLRLDVPPTKGEALTMLLQQAGWSPRPRGTTTRLGHDGFQDALVYEIGKPKDAR
jgi:hypothetical protein